MNQRIRELMDEATVIRKTFHGIEHIEFDKEKFAELIVQECIEMSKLEQARYSALANEAKSEQAFKYEFNSAATCLGVGLRIKKHFGVEE